MNSQLDKLLQEHFVYDAKSAKEYHSLSEEQKTNLSKNMIEAAFRCILMKAHKLDYELFEESKGNFHKFKGYADLEESLSVLETMRVSIQTPMPELETVKTAKDNLNKFKSEFELCFRNENLIGKMLYCNIALAVVVSTSYLISTSVDYIKSPVGTYEMHLRKKQKSVESCMIKSLNEFNKMCLSGEMQRLLHNLLHSPKTMNESINVNAAISVGKAMSTAATGAFAAAKGFLFSNIGIAASVVVLLILIIPILRQVIFQFYSMRVKIADYCRLQIEFLKMNQTKLSVLEGADKTAKRQQSIIKVLTNIADRIDVDQKSSTKRAELDIRAEENNYNMSTMVSSDDNLF